MFVDNSMSKREMPRRSLQIISVHTVTIVCRLVSHQVYDFAPVPQLPVTDGTPKLAERNQQIVQLQNEGMSVSELAKLFGISEQRISQILHKRRK